MKAQLSQVMTFLTALGSSAGDRFFPQPLRTAPELAVFVGQRAAYIAQTSLFGYLKTRMGTRFPQYFEDDEFARSIKIASVRIFASATADLSVHAVALLRREGGLDDEESAALARFCFAAALDAVMEPGDASLVPPDAASAFASRVAVTDWDKAATGQTAFAGSAADLIRLAPVTDQFKALDGEIVRNSMRFRWVNVRDQLRRRMRAEAICADWRARDD